MTVAALAFVAGLLTFIGPCSLPVLPLVVGGAAGGGRGRLAGVLAGFGASFLVTAVVAASALAALGLTTSILRLLAAVVIALAGATLALPAVSAFATRAGSRLVAWRPSGGGGPEPAPLGTTGPAPAGPVALGQGLVLGASIGLLWAPCVGPVMAAVLATAVVAGPTIWALAIAGAYVVGAIIPLAVVALAGRRVTRRIDPGGAERLRRALGVAMVAVSLAVLTGLDVPVEAALGAAVPDLAGTSIEGSKMSDTIGSVTLVDKGPAPELTGITAWINSPPLTLAELRGKVVLVHFWTFDCINCLHVQPYVKAWYATYAGQGFVVVGVHTPELSFERDLDNVRRAVAADGVTFPVAFDPSFATWNAYGNVYWPAFYFIDKRGHIRYTAAGEGGYDTEEAVIRELLAEPG